MKKIRLLLALSLALLPLGSSIFAQTRTDRPGTAHRVMMAFSIFAGREAELAAKNRRANEALIWQVWSGLFEYGASNMPDSATWVDALKASIDMCEKYEASYARAGQSKHARLYYAMNVFYTDIWNQLVKSPKIVAKFPQEMLVAVPGAPGTPWDPKAIEILGYLAMMKGSGWSAPATPSAGQNLCSGCSGIRQWRCNNCLGGGAAGFLKGWTGDPVSDTSFDRGRTGFVPKSCYKCNGTGWIRCARCNGRGVSG